jgi:F0F1-type ATP synthase assembly protein I
MKKTPATKPMPAASDPKLPQQTKDLKAEFLGAAFNLSWQLAIVFLIPVIGGFKLDEHFHKSPLYTLIGFAIAITGVVIILKNVLSEFSPGEKK